MKRLFAGPVVCLLLAGVVLSFPARGAVTLVEEGAFRWSLGGYARLLGGAQIPNISEAPESAQLPQAVGLSSSILRLAWTFRFGDLATLEVHNRLFLRGVSSQALSSGLGAGVSRTPDRSLDTQSTFFSDGGFQLEHDLDRLVLRLFIGKLDLSIGRQAISWGVSNLFTVADVWAAFSPFDLDVSQKRGIDAIRAGINLGNAELDIIVADRGPPDGDNLSGGVRATFYTDIADVYVAAGKFWMDLGLAAGVVIPIDAFKVRLEAMASFALDEDRFRLPRVTAGFDWFATPELMLTAELHFNGLGTSGDYASHLADDITVARGQSYLAGRFYGGLLAVWQAHELVSLSLTAMVNATDPSALVAWSFTYSVAQDVELGVGGFHGLGEGITIAADLTLGSELGSYGQLVYLQLAAFF